MDSQTKVNVEFKPAKRMKKRRELDALVNGKQGPSSSAAAGFRSSGGGGGGGGRGSLAPLRNGKHELLRNDSDSSEVEEFILPEKSLVRKRGTPALCSVCLTVCWGILLVVCLVGIGGLVGMYIQLKKDVDQLRVRLDKVGLINSNIPGQVQDIVAEQEVMTGRIGQLESGDKGIEKLRENFTLLAKQVFELETTAKSLSQSVANAPQLLALQSLPQQVKDISKSVADLGSNLQTMEQSVGQLQETKTQTLHQLSDIDARLKTLQLTANDQQSSEHRDIGVQALSPDDIAKLNSIVKNVALMNVTFYTNLEDLRTKYNSQQTSVLELHNLTSLLNTRVTFLEVRPTPQPLTPTDLKALVAASLQTTYEDIWNYSKAQDVMIQQNKAQMDNLITLLQTQIAGQESAISTLSDRLNRVNISLISLRNMTDLNLELLSSKLQLKDKELEAAVPVEHSNFDEAEGRTLPHSQSSASSSSSSPSSPPLLSSSTTVTLSSSIAIDRNDQNSNSVNDTDANSNSRK